MVEMTDFYSVLQRAVESLPDGSGPQRRQVYEKARKALLKQLQSFDPPLSSSDVTAQRLALEDAIRKIENEIARQNRTRRAVQGAAPSAAAPRAGAAEAPEAPRESEAEREARRRAEAERARAERNEMLRSAVSDATLDAEDEPAPQAPALPAPVQPQPAEPVDAVAEAIGADFLEEEYEDDYEQPPVPARRRAGADPTFEERIDDAHYEDVVEDDVFEDEEPEEEALSPREERRRRKEEERQLRAERRAERSGKRARRRQAAAAAPPKERKSRRGVGLARVVMPVVVLGLLVGASYAAFTQRERLMAVIDDFSTGSETTQRAPVAASTSPSVSKNEARLSADGEETRTVATTPIRVGGDNDGGDAEASATTDGSTEASANARTVGEDVSPFSADDGATPAEEQLAAVDASGAEAAVDASEAAAEELEAEVDADRADIPDIVSEGTQTAVLYEEAASDGEQGSAVPGSVEWAMVRESFGGEDAEPVVRANATIGDRGMNATVTIRENRDSGLPASHLVEIKFEVPESFEGGGVKNVPGLIMKQTEGSRGDALRGAAARVSSGLFWVALSEDAADRERNLELLASREWIDIPILYESGRRAILTLRKGNDGVRSVNAALEEWRSG